MEFFVQFAHHFMVFTDVNGILEIAAKQHWFDSDITDDDRRNRQHNQRQPHHPRGFMRFLTRSQTVMVICRDFLVVMIANVLIMRFIMCCVMIVVRSICVSYMMNLIMCTAETLFTVEHQEVQ